MSLASLGMSFSRNYFVNGTIFGGNTAWHEMRVLIVFFLNNHEEFHKLSQIHVDIHVQF
jgi:hypothetical protein